MCFFLVFTEQERNSDPSYSFENDYPTSARLCRTTERQAAEACSTASNVMSSLFYNPAVMFSYLERDAHTLFLFSLWPEQTTADKPRGIEWTPSWQLEDLWILHATWYSFPPGRPPGCPTKKHRDGASQSSLKANAPQHQPDKNHT